MVPHVVVSACLLVCCVSAQDPIITEFMAVNRGGLTDIDGDHPDWVEVHNPGGTAIDLAGWHLTDDAGKPTQWTFPSHVLPPGGYLVVFASGKDRKTSGLELHTNFKIADSGEFLGLAAPGGARWSSQFAPTYPPQYPNISYGFESGAATLFTAPSDCRAHVPTNGNLGNSWLQPAFNDNSWTAGKTGVGYSRRLFFYGSLLQLDVQGAMYGVNGSVFVRVPFTVTNAAAVKKLSLWMWYDDGYVAYLNGVEVARKNAPAQLAWDSLSATSRSLVSSLFSEPVDISQHVGSLRNGTNTLAIHGLNDAKSSTECLVRPELTADFGHAGNGTYFDAPTPGARNGKGAVGVVAPVTIHGRRGFHDQPFHVTLSSPTPGATIRYTTDGSVPTAATGNVYAGAIAVGSTTTLRAAAFLRDHVPSSTGTQSYLFAAQVLNQPRNPAGFPQIWGPISADYEMDPVVVNDPRYAARVRSALIRLPSISIVMDRGDLFDPQRGIYSNPQGSGVAWERPASMEYIPGPGDNDPIESFQVDVGIRIQGGDGGSRRPTNTPKHAFRLLFKGKYGPPRLEVPLFGAAGQRSFNTLVLRAQYNDGWTINRAHGDLRWAAYVRDQFARDAHRAMGNASPAGGWAHLYVNGLYWGVYNPCERPDAAFLADVFGGNKRDYDALKHQWGTIVDGDKRAFDAVMAYAGGGVTSKARYDRFKQLVDVRNMADYMLLNFWNANTDWPHNNWYMGARRVPPGPFRFYSWDAERAMRDLTTVRTSVSHGSTPAFLYAAARNNLEFRTLFGDRAHRALFAGGTLTTAAVRDRLERIAARIETALVAESARWGDVWRNPPYTVDGDWRGNISFLTTQFATQRPSRVISELRRVGLYPSVTAPTLSHNGGPVAHAFQLSISAPTGTIYYTLDGTDPRREGGALSGSARLYGSPIILTRSVLVKARVRSGSSWSALVDATFAVRRFAINELLADNVTGIRDNFGEREDWIELVNLTNTPQPASGMFLSDDPAAPNKWQIPPGHTVPPGGHLLIWADDDGGQGPLHANFKLGKGGEQVLLHDVGGAIQVDRVDFGPQRSDVATGRLVDGGGPVVSLLDPTPDQPNDTAACGVRRYAGARIDAHPMVLDVVGAVRIGTTPTLQLTAGRPSSNPQLFLSLQPGHFPFERGTVVLFGAPFSGPFAVPTDPQGSYGLPLPIPPNVQLVGLDIYFQNFDVDAGNGLIASNAVRIRICR